MLAMRPPPADLAALVERHQDDVWCYLRVLGCSAAQADDLVQEAFLSLLRGPFEFVNDAATRAWLRQAARRLFLMSVRRDELLDRERLAERYEQLSPEGEYLEALRECLDGLADGRARRAVELRFRAGASSAEAAVALGITEDHVNTLVHRTKAILRDCVERRIR